MTTITEQSPAAVDAPQKRGLDLRRVRWWRVVVLGVLAVYFLVPLAATFWFTVYTPGTHRFSLAPYSQMFSAPGFGTSVRMTVEVALLTIVILYVLLVPAMIAVQLRLPKLKPILESLAMVPLVLSPVALVVGVQTVLGWGLNQDPGTPLFQLAADLQNQTFPLILPIVYVLIALPFAYRSLDAQLRTVDLKTLVEASRGLGASWPVTIWRAVLPNLRSGLLSGAILTLALVFGEYTISSILQFLPFSVWIVQDGQGATSGQLAPAVSLLSLLLSWAVLFLVSFLGGRRAVGRTDRSS
ncbi:ABC transporter permease [Actinospica sp.]|jgi:putative spermidine/putrescine transport system permease protein|uniref:ABC transporter permease n=1 Tax=Actinospica sp. TaxID=1872142 RepID=UPI002C67EF87|nr:ABC transporter permease subunit [Actinospica sp.]HWG25209.1 ABC transporter permease subunit [Actinospica sp.]